MSRFLADARALLGDEGVPFDSGAWPPPPLLDLDDAGGVMCVGCGLIPAHRACETCPKTSVRLWREHQAARPPSFWRRLLPFRRKA
jgi:hypothetical protein